MIDIALYYLVNQYLCCKEMFVIRSDGHFEIVLMSIFNVKGI